MARKRPPRPVIAGVVLLVLAGLGAWWWVSRPAADVGLRASGAVEANQYQVASALVGRVTEVTVAEGDRVQAGDVLVRLDTRALDLQVTQAEQGVAAAEAAVKQARNDGTDAEVAEARARVAQARAAVELAKVQRSYATVTAPHAGVVTALVTNAGANAAPGRTLLTITDTADLFARVYVPETGLGALTVGSAARLTADGVPAAKGTVTFVATDAEFTPNNVQTADQRTKLVYEVRIRLDAPGPAWKPGLPVDVSFG